MVGSAKPSPLLRRTPSMYRISGRSGAGPGSPHCVLLAAAALAALLVSTSYTVVPFLSGARHATRARKGSASASGVAGHDRSNGLAALRQIETLFPKEVAHMMRKRAAEAGALRPQVEAASDWRRGMAGQRRRTQSVATEEPSSAAAALQAEAGSVKGAASRASLEAEAAGVQDGASGFSLGTEAGTGQGTETGGGQPSAPAGAGAAEGLIRTVAEGQEVQGGGAASESQSLSSATQSSAGAGGQGAGSSSLAVNVFREGQDQMVRLMKDQLIMARAYASLAGQSGSAKLAKELKARIKDSAKALGEADKDTELAPNALDKMRAMGQALAKAKDRHYDCTALVKKLRAMVHATEDQNAVLRRQGLFLSQVAARTVPKGLFCLHMRLTAEFWALPPDQQRGGPVLSLGGGGGEGGGPSALPQRLQDKSLYHYALFSDNVLACAVVVNSTISNCKNSSQHVIHIVTDKLTYGAMKAWFALSPPGDAALEVLNIDDFKWLNASYCPVLHQLESAAMKEFYFKVQQRGDGAAGGKSDAGAQLKYRNPKYLSMLNHLRFYLPEVFPALDKVLFLDDDIVVQRDLTPLWEVDLGGNVNGAVETCGTSFHRFNKYLNFSNPVIATKFDPQACGWAYGMNMFDLVEWKKKDITGIYHHWQTLNEERTLWKLGTLPPGLITFYNLTHSLPKHWHFLGLGYNANLNLEELERAAVIHFNGNMKPWLEIAMPQFKGYWSKYVDYGSPFLQQCNINP